MTPEQCIAARALLGWSRLQLAVAAGCTTATVGSFEERKRSPHRSIRSGLETALAAAGVSFADGGPSLTDPAPAPGDTRPNFGWRRGTSPNHQLIQALQDLAAQAEAEGFTDTMAVLRDTLAEMRRGARSVPVSPDRRPRPLA